MSKEPINQQWRTPQDFFDMLDREVGGFHVDVASDEKNYKVLNRTEDSLNRDWFDGKNYTIGDGYYTKEYDPYVKFAWCNPPYAKPLPWVKHAVEQVDKYPGACVYMLLNHDASTKWYNLALGHATEIRILTKKRIQFEAPKGLKASSNSKAQCVIVFRKKPKEMPCHVWHWDWTKQLEEENENETSD
jgi:phage N-6-adenine-methyltransferase